jgi:hypothetical protein
MDGADHRPFGGYLLDPSHKELAEPSCLLDLSEHRLDHLLAQSVAAAAPHRLADLTNPAVCYRLRRSRVNLKNVDLFRAMGCIPYAHRN